MRFIPAVSPVQIQSPLPKPGEMYHVSPGPLKGLSGPLVKWLRHGPFTAVTWVRVPYGSPHRQSVRGLPTIGGLAQLVRAPASHAGGHWFESSSLHQKVPGFVRNQELFLFMGLYNCVLHLLFLRDPNADPKAESTGERRIVLSTPLPLFFVFTWPGRSDPPSSRLCACGCRLSDRCFFGMVSVLSLVVNTQATMTPGGITRSRFTPTTSIKIRKWNPPLPRRTATFPISGSG